LAGSNLAGADEDRTLARLRGLRSDLIDPAIAAHHGRIVKRTGDGSIIEFRSVVDAVRCAIEVQNGLIERNAGVPEDRRIEFRFGGKPRRQGALGSSSEHPKRSMSPIARSVAPNSSAPASEVTLRPSKAATTGRPSTSSNPNQSGIQSVCIEALREPS
jgi:hypothetical protein